MNKAQLISKISEKSDVNKLVAEKVLNSTLDSIQEALIEEGALTLVGFGTFSVNERAARQGRNPQTGKAIQIAAKKVVKFKPGKNFREIVNK